MRPAGGDVKVAAKAGKVPWEVRAEQIYKRFPTVENFNWDRALEQDMDLFGRVVRDILKAELAVPGRPGPRPSLDSGDSTRRMQQLLGKDFSCLPFHEALAVLKGKRSLRSLAAKVHLNKDLLHKLLTQKVEPDGYCMRLCAEAFDKHPSYFLEWRILWITAAMVRRLEWSPETTIDLFRAMDFQRKDSVS